MKLKEARQAVASPLSLRSAYATLALIRAR